MKFSNFVGIDVSKEKIDVFSLDGSRHSIVKNNEASIQEKFQSFDASKTLFVLENTGGYERRCLKTLLHSGFKVHRTNNNRVTHYIESLGQKAKTDKIAAKCLAKYGKERHRELDIYKPSDEKQEKIRQLALYLSSLKATRAKEKNRFQCPACDLICEEIEDMLRLLDEKISVTEQELENLVKSDDETREKIELMTQYKGIGKITAIQLAAHLPELGKISNRAIGALAGVCPYDKSSGKKKGHKITKAGRRQLIKPMMFMAVMAATRYNPEIKSFYERLVSRDRNSPRKMIALVACMRKMLVHLNAILKRGEILK
ncbi:MAG: transposase [Holosporaceae bacterium]|jgi:transposase|nr:transposase [Holosporaceae bacterium]